MIQEKFHAFLDDCGDSGLVLGNPKTSRLYVLAAVIVADADLDRVRDEVEQVRSQHFQRGPIKSSKIGNRHHVRAEVLEHLQRVDFKAMVFVIQKKRLARSRGLRYRDVFVKFVSKPIYESLCMGYEDITLTADRRGDADFMVSFQEYIRREAMPLTLFPGKPEIDFVNSHDEVLVQLADLIAGTVARAVNQSGPERTHAFLRRIWPKLLGLEVWPGEYGSHIVMQADRNGIQIHHELAQYAIRAAESFCERNHHLSTKRLQVCFVEHLLSHLRFTDMRSYVSTYEATTHIAEATGKPMEKDDLRRLVVGPVRDAGVLIASGRSGYKIPISLNDVLDFVNHDSSIIVPMVNRLKRFREGVMLATHGELDVVARPQYSLLRRLLDDVDAVVLDQTEEGGDE